MDRDIFPPPSPSGGVGGGFRGSSGGSSRGARAPPTRGDGRSPPSPQPRPREHRGTPTASRHRGGGGGGSGGGGGGGGTSTPRATSSAATQAPSSPEFSGSGGGRGGGIGGGVGGSRRFARLRAKFRLVLSAGASTSAPEWSHVVAVVAPLRSAPAFTCPVCLEPPAGLAPVVTMCGHVFCSADWLSCVASASRGAIDAICASAPPPLGHSHAAAAARAALSSVALQCPLCAEWLEGDGVRPIWFGGAPYEKATAYLLHILLHIWLHAVIIICIHSNYLF